jgi:hypothetical protein
VNVSIITMPPPIVVQTLLLAAAAAAAANPPPGPSSAEARHASVDFATMDLTPEQWEAKFKYLNDNMGM